MDAAAGIPDRSLDWPSTLVEGAFNLRKKRRWAQKTTVTWSSSVEGLAIADPRAA